MIYCLLPLCRTTCSRSNMLQNQNRCLHGMMVHHMRLGVPMPQVTAVLQIRHLICMRLQHQLIADKVSDTVLTVDSISKRRIASLFQAIGTFSEASLPSNMTMTWRPTEMLFLAHHLADAGQQAYIVCSALWRKTLLFLFGLIDCIGSDIPLHVSP
jgi:hypothetical protein